MSTTADQNQGGGAVVNDIMSLDDDGLMAALGVDIGGSTSEKPSNDAATPKPEGEPSQDADAETEANTEDSDGSDGGDVAPEGEAEKPEGEGEDEGAEGEDKGEQADDKPAEEKKPLAPFTAVAKDGKPVAAEDVRVTFRAAKREFKDVPLDKLVRMAQSGGYNEQLQGEVDALRGEVPELRQHNEELVQALEDQRALNLKLLDDDDYLLQLRERRAAELTPEARASRAEARAAEVERRAALAETQRAGVAFYQTEIQPKLEQVIQAHTHNGKPTITEDELFGKFTRLVGPLTRNGTVPQSQWRKVAEIVANDILPWADQLHETRVAALREVESKSAVEVQKAKRETAETKRKVARAMSPTPTGAGRPSAPRRIKTAEDAVESILDDAFAPVR